MKSTEQIKADIDTLVRKQGNQGALSLGDVLDDIVDNLNVVNNMMANIPDVATFQAAVPKTATEIVLAYYGGVDLTGYTKSSNIGKDIDVYADGTKYTVVSGKTIFAPENSAEFFKGYSALTSLDLSNFNTANVTDMRNMFSGCAALTSLDLSNFNTTNVTNMLTMFFGCTALTSLDLPNFNTTNVTDMGGMFSSCAALTSLNLSNFNTTNVTNMGGMFSSCAALTSLDLSNFNTTNVTNMSYMFGNCAALTSLNLSNFNTTNVTNMGGMFSSCAALTSLDLSNFNTTNVTGMGGMFRSSSGLTTIIATDWSATVSSSAMFYGCTSLIGGNGTTYDAAHTNATYAHIDVADNPGYFTAPA